MDHGMLIGLKTKEHKYKKIITKLLSKEELDNDEKMFLEKEEVV